ncbi:MAG: CotH kinase family protein [Planctomycetes bacterium]|nr:CotH kinase family protein [Planctomycetota bacterium]
MRRTRSLLRDVVLLTLPFLAASVWLWIAALGSFWNAEIRNFHGELVRDLRVGTLRMMVQRTIRDVFGSAPRRFLPLKREVPAIAVDAGAEDDGVDVFDLRIDGAAIDELAADLPGSARERKDALLEVNNGELLEVDATWRGQRMDNYFYARRSWKLRTKKREFVGGQRVLNLTPLEDRLASLVTFDLARSRGLPAPRTRLVHLYVNLEDEGVYLLEEQVDESFLRRVGEMPGDLFYGELFVPDVPPHASWDLSWNPYLWEKQARWNKYPESWRPWLSDLLDAAADPSPAGLDALDEILDPSFALYYAILSYFGDQHVDLSHNQKIGLDLLAGKLSGYLWNPLLNMPAGQGVETTASRLFLRLAQDPRFLDRVARLVSEQLAAEETPRVQLAALDRAERALRRAQVPVDRWLEVAFRGMRRKVEERHATVRQQHAIAEVAYEVGAAKEGVVPLELHATAVASLRLTALDFEAPPAALALFEDRDFDGAIGPGDREVATRLEGHRLVVDDAAALLAVGRDFTASYQQRPSEGQDTFSQHREFTRLAALRSPFLLRVGAAPLPRLLGIEAERTVGSGAVAAHEGPPHGFIATESVHPWRRAAPPAPQQLEWSGTVELRQTLRLEPRDSLAIAPGSVVRMGPGVSLQLHSRVEWRDVRFERLDPARPFGVVALQGHGCDGSVLDGVTITGGSEATVGYLYYSGMFSAHLVDRLVVRDSAFSANLLGDDTVRLGKCHDVVFERVRVEDAIADAIDFDLCTGVVRDVTVLRPLNDGFDMMTGRLTVERLQVEGAGDKGISIGEDSQPELVGCSFKGCVTGIGIKDGSDPRIVDTLIEGCATGVASYDKNWRYEGGGFGRLLRCTLRGNKVDVKLDADSTVTLEQCTTEGKFSLPKKSRSAGLIVKPAPEGTP